MVAVSAASFVVSAAPVDSTAGMSAAVVFITSATIATIAAVSNHLLDLPSSAEAVVVSFLIVVGRSIPRAGHTELWQPRTASCAARRARSSAGRVRARATAPRRPYKPQRHATRCPAAWSRPARCVWTPLACGLPPCVWTSLACELLSVDRVHCRCVWTVYAAARMLPCTRCPPIQLNSNVCAVLRILLCYSR